MKGRRVREKAVRTKEHILRNWRMHTIAASMINPQEHSKRWKIQAPKPVAERGGGRCKRQVGSEFQAWDPL